MLVVMSQTAQSSDIDRVVAAIQALGFEARPIPGEKRTSIGVVGNDGRIEADSIQGLPGVQEVLHVSAPYKLVSREWQSRNTVIRLPNGVEIGGDQVIVMAGPCGVESEAQLMTTAEVVHAAGARVLRGGAFKPRSSPYSFQGMGEEGLKLLAKAREVYGLAIISEAIDEPSLDLVEQYADIIQLGARNMQNFALLKRAGRSTKPVLLKRAPAATFKEWLLAAEYILAGGNQQVILCERGIRGFEEYTRNTFDLSAIPSMKHLSHLPVVADPSHGTGRRELIQGVSQGAVAAGADGLLIEVHCNPLEAKSDGPQSLYPEQFRTLMQGVAAVVSAVGRSV